MISKDLEAKIVRLVLAEKWKPGTVASQLGLHYSVVERVLSGVGVPVLRHQPRRSIADPFLPFIIETLEKYPTLTAARLHQMVCERGYPGREAHFRAIVRRYRPKPVAEAYLRLRTLPGEQAQVDWAHFGKLEVGKAQRPLMAFIMVLSWSRHIFVRFFLGQGQANFLRGHVEAFDAFSGVPRTLLYDNLKSAVLERRQDAIRFHPVLLDFAKHYRYEPRPVAVARGNEKGRVERAIRYLRSAFFVARKWRNLDDLNAQVRLWCTGVAAERKCPEDDTLTVGQAFEQEQPLLLALPDNPYPTDERTEAKVGKSPYVRFDKNDYSVPHTHVRRSLTVIADEKTVRIVDGQEVIATHPRTYDRGQQVENPEHIAELVAAKHNARRHRGMDRLKHAAPSSTQLLIQAAERGASLGNTTSALLRLLDHFGAQDLEAAIAEAIESDTPHPPGVRQILDRLRHERGQPPPIPVSLPDDPRLRDLVVKPHNLDTYDTIAKENDDDQDPDSRE